MRLWHEDLIEALDRQRLLAQHRECCALRGLGWGKKHATVDYVFTYSPAHLIAYHNKVMDEMEKRGYKPNPVWREINYRGKDIGFMGRITQEEVDVAARLKPIFKEHDDIYYAFCVKLLKDKDPFYYIFLEEKCETH